MDTSFEIKTFELFDKGWALLTAGPIDNHNSMTISWGETGTLWSKPVVTVYVKPCRFTHSFMENNDYFVVSFFRNEFKRALGVMGSNSGRDMNKDEKSGLTPIDHNGVTIYQEAEVTIICKKIYHNDLILEHIPEDAKERYYEIEKPHTMFVGEVVKIIK